MENNAVSIGLLEGGEGRRLGAVNEKAAWAKRRSYLVPRRLVPKK